MKLPKWSGLLLFPLAALFYVVHDSEIPQARGLVCAYPVLTFLALVGIAIRHRSLSSLAAFWWCAWIAFLLALVPLWNETTSPISRDFLRIRPGMSWDAANALLDRYHVSHTLHDGGDPGWQRLTFKLKGNARVGFSALRVEFQNGKVVGREIVNDYTGE